MAYCFDKLLLFVHIPKTAGTSLRVGLTQTLGQGNVLLDYGLGAPETDQRIKDLYDAPSFLKKNVAKLLEVEQIKMFCGHFPYRRYAEVLPQAKVMSFVREPLQRCYSEFLHWQKYNGYAESFTVFFAQQGQINLQSKWLSGVGNDALVGVSEGYGMSIQMINHAMNISLPELRLNTRRKNIAKPYPLDLIGHDNAKLFYSLNQEDVLLYQRVVSHCERSFNDRPSLARCFAGVRCKLRTCLHSLLK